MCIVFTNITRSAPDDILVPALLHELQSSGVRDSDITLLCGISMHRPSTRAEKITKLGSYIVARYRVIDIEPQNPNARVDLGVTLGGVPESVHRAAVDTDLLIAPAFSSHVSMPGIRADEKHERLTRRAVLIAQMHGPAFVDCIMVWVLISGFWRCRMHY